MEERRNHWRTPTLQDWISQKQILIVMVGNARGYHHVDEGSFVDVDHLLMLVLYWLGGGLGNVEAELEMIAVAEEVRNM